MNSNFPDDETNNLTGSEPIVKSVKIPKELLERIKTATRQKAVTFSYWIRLACEEKLARNAIEDNLEVKMDTQPIVNVLDSFLKDIKHSNIVLHEKYDDLRITNVKKLDEVIAVLQVLYAQRRKPKKTQEESQGMAISMPDPNEKLKERILISIESSRKGKTTGDLHKEMIGSDVTTIQNILMELEDENLISTIRGIHVLKMLKD